MDQGIYTAAAGANVMQDRLAMISNNVANSNTTGFKRDEMQISQFSRQLDTAMLAEGDFKRVPVDVLASNIYTDLSSGGLHETGNSLDVAILGEGFFVVESPEGQRLTRNGSFGRSPEGLLVTQQGFLVQGEGGEIAIGDGDIFIEGDGTIRQNGQVLDRLQVAGVDSADIERAGLGLYKIREGAQQVEVSASIQQGAIESSNVEPVKEMVNLINTQRAFESFQKVIKTFDDTYSFSIRNVGATL